jgi:hypothetical protein
MGARPSRARRAARRDPAGAASGASGPSLALGFVACAPLFVAYELALAIRVDLRRNGAEVGLLLPVELLAPGWPWARALLLALALAAAVVVLRQRGAFPWQGLARTIGEGALAGLVLGPALVLLTGLLRTPAGAVLDLHLPTARPDAPPSLVPLMRLAGGAGFEELLFRVGALGILYLLVARAAVFLGASARVARLLAEIVALIGSALLFAAFHLEAVQSGLGLLGEAFRADVFLWRVLAGMALAGLFRWKGLGVAALAHALLNVGLALGAGAGIFAAH